MRKTNLPTPIRRALTNELVKGLRQGERHWYPVFDDSSSPPQLGGGDGGFRIIGAGMASAATYATHYVFRYEVRPYKVPSSAGFISISSHRLTMSEEVYDAALDDLEEIGLYCGRCQGFPARGVECCELAELYRVPFSVFKEQADGLYRYAQYISLDVMQVAVALFDSCNVIPLSTEGEADIKAAKEKAFAAKIVSEP